MIRRGFKMTDTELHALGFTRQSKTMWRKGDVTYQNGKFYRQGKEISYDPHEAEEGEREMTSREKAIEALKEIGNVIEFSDCGEWDYNAIKYTHKEEIEIMAEQLNQPTLDDAIAVAEEIIDRNRYKLKLETNQNDRLYYSRRLIAYGEILTALRGLKVEK